MRLLNPLGVLIAVLALGCAFRTGAVDEIGASKKARPRVEVVFCIDTTSSMSGLIAGAQQKIWSIVNGIASGKPTPEIKVGLVAFRDKSDAYVTQVTDLTSDLDAIHKTLFGFQAQGGGDTPEHVNQALYDAVHKISWAPKGEKVYRTIFLVGDAPPHMDYSDDVKYPDTCKEAMLKDLIINTVRCGTAADTETVWQEIARKSEGQYTSIEQNGGVAVIATPFDKEMAELSGKLVGAGMYYGNAKRRELAQAAQRAAKAEATDAKDASPEKVSLLAEKGEYRGKAAAATSAPAAGEAKASDAVAGMGMGEEVGRADLLAAVERDGEALKKIKEEELPDEMKKLAAEERKALVEKRIAERAEIQKQIEALAKKRSQYLQDEQKKLGSGDKGFDGVVKKMLQEQGSKKGIEYGEEKK